MTIHKLENSITSDIGVIVGRFQVDNLHDGHMDMIETVCSRHKRVLILVGTITAQPDGDDPLDYISRELMIKSAFPNVFVQPIQDFLESDVIWSKNVDTAIRNIFPKGDILLYGSRDSFIEYYHGKYDCVELPAVYTSTGTNIRDKIKQGVYDNPSFRTGCIYTFGNMHDNVFAVVDIAIINSTKQEILLGRKEGRDGYCFIGGFVDPTDDNYEHAARRETMEETGLVIESFEYITNGKIDDIRYRNRKNKIFSTLFVGEYVSGRPQPNDDMHELKWFKFEELTESLFIDSHKPFYNKLIEYLRLYYMRTISSTDINDFYISDNMNKVSIFNEILKTKKCPTKERFDKIIKK